MPDVSIISGSKSDQHVVDRILRVLDDHGVSYEHRVISAHRNPKDLDQYIESSDARVFIAVAGMSAALPGAVAARTERPVIGVPVGGKLLGIDALLSIVQMPPGVPVACVGIDAGENAALLALRMLKS